MYCINTELWLPVDGISVKISLFINGVWKLHLLAVA